MNKAYKMFNSIPYQVDDRIQLDMTAELNKLMRKHAVRPKHIVILFGASGSGKDTAADVLTNNYTFQHVKFARPMKAFVEQCYGLPAGALDKKEYKERTLPNSDKTYTDLMVGMFKLWQQFDDAMTARNVINFIKHLTTQTLTNVVLSDVRKVCESELLLECLRDYKNINLHIVRIEGRGVMLESDQEQHKCYELLKHYSTTLHFVHNNSTKEVFESKIKMFASKIGV